MSYHDQTLVFINTDMAHKDVHACVVSCIDPRFPSARAAALDRMGVKVPDSIQVAGGGKDLAGTHMSPDVQYILKQIEASIRLHHPERVVVMFHTDCGAYGGRGGRTEEEEYAFFQGEFKKALANIRKRGIDLPVQGVFLGSEDLHWLLPA